MGNELTSLGDSHVVDSEKVVNDIRTLFLPLHVVSNAGQTEENRGTIY
jgi:hypothetical protein